MNFQLSNRSICLLTDFIPIIVLYLFVSQPKEMIYFSNTSLGKLLVVAILLFYSSISLAHGLLACSILILYYQTDLVEHQLHNYSDIRFEEGMMNLSYDLWNGTINAASQALPTALEPAPVASEELTGFAKGAADIYAFSSSLTEGEKRGALEKQLSTADPYNGHGMVKMDLFPYLF